VLWCLNYWHHESHAKDGSLESGVRISEAARTRSTIFLGSGKELVSSDIVSLKTSVPVVNPTPLHFAGQSNANCPIATDAAVTALDLPLELSYGSLSSIPRSALRSSSPSSLSSTISPTSSLSDSPVSLGIDQHHRRHRQPSEETMRNGKSRDTDEWTGRGDDHADCSNKVGLGQVGRGNHELSGSHVHKSKEGEDADEISGIHGGARPGRGAVDNGDVTDRRGNVGGGEMSGIVDGFTGTSLMLRRWLSTSCCLCCLPSETDTHTASNTGCGYRSATSNLTRQVMVADTSSQQESPIDPGILPSNSRQPSTHALATHLADYQMAECATQIDVCTTMRAALSATSAVVVASVSATNQGALSLKRPKGAVCGQIPCHTSSELHATPAITSVLSPSIAFRRHQGHLPPLLPPAVSVVWPSGASLTESSTTPDSLGAAWRASPGNQPGSRVRKQQAMVLKSKLFECAMHLGYRRRDVLHAD
ncbi:unnamed protein product, partial [Protopolystoma xenopodis]